MQPALFMSEVTVNIFEENLTYKNINGIEKEAFAINVDSCNLSGVTDLTTHDSHFR